MGSPGHKQTHTVTVKRTQPIVDDSPRVQSDAKSKTGPKFSRVGAKRFIANAIANIGLEDRLV